MNRNIVRELNKIRAKTSSRAFKNLPSMFFFTDRKRISNIFSVIEKLPSDAAIIIREYDLNFADKLDFATRIVKIAAKKNLKIFVGKDLKLAKKIKADGIHFSDFDRNIKPSIIPKNMAISYSCHNTKSLFLAKKIKADLVFYSPIFKSDSHPNQKPIGVYNLRNFSRENNIATYALGGINQKNIKLLSSTNIRGIGGISLF